MCEPSSKCLRTSWSKSPGEDKSTFSTSRGSPHMKLLQTTLHTVSIFILIGNLSIVGIMGHQHSGVYATGLELKGGGGGDQLGLVQLNGNSATLVKLIEPQLLLNNDGDSSPSKNALDIDHFNKSEDIVPVPHSAKVKLKLKKPTPFNNGVKNVRNKPPKKEGDHETDDPNASVPVVPIQLPPPNATLRYHYTDDGPLKFKTDFSRIILPFKATQNDLKNPNNYRDFDLNPEDFDFEDFAPDLHSKDFPDLTHSSSNIHFNEVMYANASGGVNTIKTNIIKRKKGNDRRPQKFRDRDDHHQHDSPQISHELGLKTSKKLKTQHNYDVKNNNKSGKSDNSELNVNLGRNKLKLKLNKKGKDNEEGDFLDPNSFETFQHFESKKLPKTKRLLNNKIGLDNSSTTLDKGIGNSIPGSSLEEVALSLNYDNRDEDEEGKSSLMRRRPRRSVVHLYDMVVCATGCNPLAYKGYGCYCGFLGSGLTVDGIDRCCAKHDWCYHHAKCPPFLTYFVPYYWTCNDGRPRCVTEYRGWKGVCGANLCECDRQFAECLRKFPCPRSRAMCMTSPWRFWQNFLMFPRYDTVTFRHHHY